MKPSTKHGNRFVKSVLATAAQTKVDLPWARGSDRAKTLARRHAKAVVLRRA